MELTRGMIYNYTKVQKKFKKKIQKKFKKNFKKFQKKFQKISKKFQKIFQKISKNFKIQKTQNIYEILWCLAILVWPLR